MIEGKRRNFVTKNRSKNVVLNWIALVTGATPRQKKFVVVLKEKEGVKTLLPVIKGTTRGKRLTSEKHR